MRHTYLLAFLAACGGGAPPPPPPAAQPNAPRAGTGPVTLRAMRVNGTVLYFRLVGDSGTPVVFVHGSLGDYRTWNTQVPAFALTHRVLAYSRRYHPPNPPQNDDETYSPMLHADDLAALLLALELPPAHIVGASYGAYTALVLAQEHPELVRSVVLGEPPIMPLLTLTQEGDALRRTFYTSVLDPARGAFARGDSVAALRAFMDGSSGTPGTFDALPPAARGDALAHAFEFRREMLANRDEHFPPITCVELGRLHTPVLLLTGERSTRLFRLITDELARCLTTDTTVVIPGAGHAMNAMNPGYYNGIVLRYLSTH